MYKIVKILDKNGYSKDDFFAEIKANHPDMTGEILYPESLGVGSSLYFKWSDSSARALVTSTIKKYTNDSGRLEVVTRNSIYYLEEIK